MSDAGSVGPGASGRAHLAALVWMVLVAAVFLAPVVAGRSFSVVEARMADNHPWAAALEGRVEGSPAQADSADLSVPWQHQLDAALEQGTLAFWAPDVFGGGSPLFANGTSAQLYPPRLALTLLAPERWFHDLWVAFHLVGGGFVAYLLGRELSRSWGAAVVGGTAWMLGSFNLGWAHLEVVTPMMIGIPLSLWAVHRAWRRRSAGAAVTAAVALGVILVSGHLLWMLFIWEMAAVYAACLAARGVWTRRAAGAGVLTAARHEAWIPLTSFGGGALLSSAVLWPSLATLTRTPRTPFDVSALESFLASSRLVTTWLWWPPPHDPMTTTVMNGRLAFVGTLTALLALVGALTRREGAGLARGVVALTTLVMVWAPAARLAYELIPGMNVMYPYSRLAGWMAIGLVVAAMVGVDVITERALAQRVGPASRRVAAAGALAAAFVVAVQLIPLGRALNPPFQDRDDAAWFPTTPVVEAALALPPHRGWPARIAPITTDYEGLTPGGPPILWANHPVMWGLDTLSGYDSTLPRPAAEVLRSLAGDDPAYVVDHPLVGAYVPVFELRRSRLEDFAAAGIDAVMVVPEIDPADPELAALGPHRVAASGSDGSLLVLDRPGSGPYLAASIEVVGPTSVDTLTATLSAAGRDRRVVVSAAELDDVGRAEDSACPPPCGPTTLAGGSERGEAVTTVERGINSVSMTVDTDRPGLLVVPVNVDPGWSATVDGVETEIATVNHSHIGVVVPAGGSAIELRYLPPLLRPGIATSVATALVLAGLAGRSRSRRRPDGGAEAAAPPLDEEDASAVSEAE